LRAATAILPAAGRVDDQPIPWAARLLPLTARHQVVAFHRFAAAATAIADAPSLTAEEKLNRFDALDEALLGRSQAGSAAVLRREVRGDELLLIHAGELLHAFRRDAVCDHCRDWADLMNYCRFSAVPIGRFVLDAHGEDPAAFAASDALCVAIQILDLIRSSGSDYRDLGRVYMPRDWLLRAGVESDAFADEASSPQLRRVFDEVLDGVDGLIELSRGLARHLRDRRMQMLADAAVLLAQRLSCRLRVADPLAGPVSLSAWDCVAAAFGALLGSRAAA
jgi:phytoene/squalene synthetase